VSQGPIPNSKSWQRNKFGLGPVCLPHVRFPATSEDYWTNRELNNQEKFNCSASQQVGKSKIDFVDKNLQMLNGKMVLVIPAVDFINI